MVGEWARLRMVLVDETGSLMEWVHGLWKPWLKAGNGMLTFYPVAGDGCSYDEG